MIYHLDTQHSRLLGSLLCCLLTIGCQSGPARPVCQPASGKVLLDNRPVPEAQLTFHPQQSAMELLPTAVTRDDGQFQATTWADKDGIPVGDYVVTIVWKQLVLQGEEKVRNGPNQLPAIYADPKKSPLRCTIKEGANKLPTFELKR
ncbi:MAG: hypothetical protein QM703_11765 [Gemmatales bacterium]